MSISVNASAPAPAPPTITTDNATNGNTNMNATGTKTPEKEQEKAATPSTTSKLEAEIEQLQALATRLRAVRSAPASLAMDDITRTLSDKTRNALGELQGLRDALLSVDAQGALAAAAASEKADRSGIRGGLRREARKRKRSITPETPQPYVAPRAPSIFPTPTPTPPPTTITSVPQLVRDFNAKHGRTAQMRLCMPSGRTPPATSPPILLRVRLPDVLTAYITLDIPSSEDGSSKPLRDRTLTVAHVAIFGARERLPPHSQSAFLVFQKMSQHILSMVQSAPTVPPGVLADMLVTYQGVFSASCVACERILSQEGYLPPIARIWREPNGDGAGSWESRHVTCMQR
ncbi:hypothetical protein PENSPDRAFT_670804 [Peniophora sp. CONT]|nr:hypothetical protein PENSPDRAFT_670804 [Peniophora sp. CONT]